MERLGPRDPEAEHQSRLVGMALLLGDLTPAALSALGEEDVRKALLAKLPLETLVYLENQVAELEVFLKPGTQVPTPAEFRNAQTRPAWSSLASLPREEDAGPGPAGYFEPQLNLGHQILAKLTLAERRLPDLFLFYPHAENDYLGFDALTLGQGQCQLGFGIGGPIFKDKLFFFADVERIKQDEAGASTTSPTCSTPQRAWSPCSAATC